MPTRFKYTKSKSTAFGLTPAEILLATDKELDAIAGLKHIAPYRKHGLGMQGRGISKRIYDLKQKLRQRKWGEDPDAADEQGQGQDKRSRDSGWSTSTSTGTKRKADTTSTDGGQGDSDRKKKRMGKKQRQKAAAAAANGQGDEAAASASATAPNGNRYEGMEQTSAVQPAQAEGASGEAGKAKRRKKKGGDKKKPEDLQIFD